MTEDQFWKGDPQLYFMYENAYIEKQKQEQKISDYRNWQLGQYFAAAIGINFSKEVKYPKEPMFSDFDEQSEEMSEERLKAERERTYLFFSNLGKHIDIKK